MAEKLSNRQSWSYRPSHMRDEIFRGIFSDRVEECKKISTHIDKFLVMQPLPPEKQKSVKKNYYIWGERGIGKTTLLYRLKINLRYEERHKLQNMIPVFLFEKEILNTTAELIRRIYQVITVDDFVFKSLDTGDEWQFDQRSASEKSTNLYELLEKSLAREKKKLVLFIENFDSLVYQLLRMKGEKKAIPDGQEIAQSDSQDLLLKLIENPDIIFICTGLVKNPSTKYDYGQDTFETMELLPLSDLQDLFSRRISYDQHTRLLADKDKLSGQIDLFGYLTGGNTRLMVQFYELLVYRRSNRLEYLLGEMLNSSTPLFEWVLEKFIDFKSQEIINFIVTKEGNATVKEIAQQTDSTESTIRMLLHRLKEKNILVKIDEKRDQSDIYTLKSLIFFLWFRVMMLEKKDELIDFFICFIELFFNPSIIDTRETSTISIRYRHAKEDENHFLTDTGIYRRCTEEGKFPVERMPVLEEIESISPTSVPDVEKLIYEVIKAKKDEIILQERILQAEELKSENQLEKAADLYRVIAQGYLILAETVVDNHEFFKKSADNIKEAIAIHQMINRQPFEHLRCLLLLVAVSWENCEASGCEDIKAFTSEMIRLGKKISSVTFLPLIGYAYKYQALCEKNSEERLALFQEALQSFQELDNLQYKKQLVLILVNMGLIHHKQRKYQDALDYLKKAMDLSIRYNVTAYLNPGIIFLFEFYRITGKTHEALLKVDEILEWSASGPVSNIDRKTLMNYKAFFLDRENKIAECLQCLQENYESAKKDGDSPALVLSLLNLTGLYQRLDEKEETARSIREIKDAVSSTVKLLPPSILYRIADLFYRTGDYINEMTVNQTLDQYYLGINSPGEHAGMLVNTGLCHMEGKNNEEAVKHFRDAVRVSEQHLLGGLSAIARFHLAAILRKMNKTAEALHQLEKLVKELSGSRSELEENEYEVINKQVNKQLFFIHLEKSVSAYNEKKDRDAAVMLSETMKYSDDLAMEDFVYGFFFLFLLPLIDANGKEALTFFNTVDYYLTDAYEHRKKKRFLKLFQYVTAVLRGEAPSSLFKDLSLPEIEVLQLIKKRIEAAEAAGSLKKSGQEVLSDESKKFEQIIALISLHSPGNIAQAESLMKGIKADRLDIHQKADYFYLECIMLLLSQKTSAVKEPLQELLQLIGSASPITVFLSGKLDYPGLDNRLRTLLKPVDYDLLQNIETVLRNQSPIVFFIERFSTLLSGGFFEEYKKNLPGSGQKIYDAIQETGSISLEEILTIAGSRIQLESLIYHIKIRFSRLSADKQEAIISFFKSGLEMLPESYHCLIKEFFADTIGILKDEHREILAVSFLELLKNEKSSEYFARETMAFLQAAKYLVDQKLREKIEKALLPKKI